VVAAEAAKAQESLGTQESVIMRADVAAAEAALTAAKLMAEQEAAAAAAAAVAAAAAASLQDGAAAMAALASAQQRLDAEVAANNYMEAGRIQEQLSALEATAVAAAAAARDPSLGREWPQVFTLAQLEGATDGFAGGRILACHGVQRQAAKRPRHGHQGAQA
jgi:hypothetical protein